MAHNAVTYTAQLKITLRKRYPEIRRKEEYRGSRLDG